MRRPDTLERLLTALGELLANQEVRIRLLAVGGAALSLAERIPVRPTRDIDVIAQVLVDDDARVTLVPPTSLPDGFLEAVRTVARDFSVEDDWLNTAVADQWREGLPPTAGDDLVWKEYGGLQLALAGRQTLIHLKLFAAADQGPRSVHLQDLVALRPTDAELQDARTWVADQDASSLFPHLVQQVVDHVRTELGRD